MIMIKSLLILFWLSFSVSGAYARIITDTLNSPSLSDNLLDEPSTPRILVYVPSGYDLNLQIKIFDSGRVTGVRKHIEHNVFVFFNNHFKRNTRNIPLTGIQQARAYADSLRHRLNLPGLSIAVAKNNDIIWSDGLGYADIDRQISVDPATTSFRIGSVSKLITAVAAVLLHQQGRLDLNGPIQHYLPDLPDQVSQVTARQLAGHLAGIRHYDRDEYINRTHYQNINETLSIFLNDTLRHKPGAAYAYSSYGYNLLGAVIQAAAGEEFRENVRQNLLEPLGMKSTFAEHPEMPELNRAQLYSSDQSGSFQQAIFTDMSDRWPSGGYWSTAEDMARFGIGILNDNIITQESRELLFTNQHTSSGEETGVGMGWRIGFDAQGRRIVHHGGDSIGGRAFLLVYPDRKLVVAMLSNLSFAGFGEEEAIAMAQIFLHKIEK
jgi:serine beta-lactamase-like protein LACTB, mitochondrial